jgi:hypothetical protein
VPHRRLFFVFPDFRGPGNEALKRAVIEGFEKTNTDGRIIQLLNDTQLPLKGFEIRLLLRLIHFLNGTLLL